jgi:hypothetical protein
MTSPIDSAWVAHVAEVLEDFHGATGYEATADYADVLLRANPALREMASQYHNGDAGREWLADAVNTAVQTNTDCFYCPTCHSSLESRGDFDGRLPSSGVTDGHEGFGPTFLCEQGHWFTWLQGRMVPPERILTVIERETTP